MNIRLIGSTSRSLWPAEFPTSGRSFPHSGDELPVAADVVDGKVTIDMNRRDAKLDEVKQCIGHLFIASDWSNRVPAAAGRGGELCPEPLVEDIVRRRCRQQGILSESDW